MLVRKIADETYRHNLDWQRPNLEIAISKYLEESMLASCRMFSSVSGHVHGDGRTVGCLFEAPAAWDYAALSANAARVAQKVS